MKRRLNRGKPVTKNMNKVHRPIRQGTKVWRRWRGFAVRRLSLSPSPSAQHCSRLDASS